MNNHQVKKFWYVTAVSALILLSMHPMSAIADSREDDRHGDNDRDRHAEGVIRGVAVTGQNEVLGKPFFDWGPPVGAFHFPTVGIHNENGQKPLPIDANTPGSAVLATVEPTFVTDAGSALQGLVKPEWLNVPLRDVPVNVDFAFVNRSPLPSVLKSVPLRPAQAEPGGDPITLDQWMKASGVAKIVCKRDRATVDLRMKNLMPNRMYTVWGILGLPRDGSATFFLPIPLGGTPNMFITDQNGDALFRRTIKFCPFEPELTPRPLLTINVQYHANHQSYGAVPEPSFVPGFWLGLVTFNHVQFPVNVELLDR